MMFLKTAIATLLLGGLTIACQAQTVYRITGADGRITFSDKPPTSNETVSATGRNGKAVDLNNSPLPFELRQIAEKYPVTLYSASNCTPCSTGRNLLAGRGVPFTERTVNTAEDSEALQRISGENALPFLTVGAQKVKGFSDTEWTQYLDAAGYPSATKLPTSYRNPPPAPLVALQKVEVPPKVAANNGNGTANPPAVRPPVVNNTSNPAGIRF